MNTFGTIYTLTSFGESHGVGIGGVIDGMPSGIDVDMDFIQKELNRRKPGQSSIVTPRKEDDKVEFFSGIFEGKTTGTSIGFVVYNSNQHSSDYDNIKDVYRPSHADFTYNSKYGIRDYRGGGRSSARETIARCVAGALAKLALRKYNIEIYGYTSQVGDIFLNKSYNDIDFSKIESNSVRCPDMETAQKMENLIKEVQSDGDTIGGVVSCVIKNVPVGLGEPVFGKLNSSLAAAMLSINAAKGFELGMGFEGVGKRGSEMNDVFYCTGDKVHTRTNNSGGIQGGLSNGEDIYFKTAFKPVATLLKDIETINKENENIVVKAKGRHDPCVLPRAVPIVEAMAAMVILDNILLDRSRRNF
ncbi:MAG: chorismate synthase [Bacteroidales bacterium]|nr:chorismate synthase [Bacteroidales bacterium]